MVAARLPIPAYAQLLKLSHAFNVLDARGAVGVTERASCFATMRNLARDIAGVQAHLWQACHIPVVKKEARSMWSRTRPFCLLARMGHFAIGVL